MKRYVNYLIIILISLCVLPLKGIAQSRIFKSLSVADGLSGSIVYHFLKDSTGYVWMGTENGLDRFDGVHFRHYEMDTTGDKIIYTMAEMPGGKIWAGGSTGLWTADEASGRLNPVAREVVNCGVNAMLTDKAGRMFVGSQKGLFCYVKGKWKRILLDANLLSDKNYIFALAFGQKNRLWIATRTGVYSLRLTDYKIQDRVEPFKPGELCSCISIACAGNDVFIGTDVQGLFRYNTVSKTCEPFKNVGSPVIKSLSSDASGRFLYVGTDGNGVHILSTNPAVKDEIASYCHTINTFNTIRSNSVYALLVDRDGVIWVGMYQMGVDYTLFQDGAFTLYAFPPSFDSYNMTVRALSIRGSQRLIGTRDGLYFIDEARGMVRFYTEPQLKSKLILSCTYYQGYYYVGTFRGGVYRLDPATGSILSFAAGNLPPETIVFCIVQGPDGSLWMGTSNGLYCYQNGRQTAYFNKSNSQLPGNNVMCLYFDRTGKGWMGTEKGMCVYDPSSHTLRPDVFPDGFFNKEYISNIYQDHKGMLYFTSAKGTLFVSDPDMKRYGTFLPELFKDGLKCMFVAQDKENRLWFGTNNGLYRYDHHIIHPYAFIDGIPSPFFLNCQPVLDEFGRLWVGNTQGLVWYRDKESDVHFLPYAIRVTDVLMNGESIGGEVIHHTDKGDRLQVDIPKNGELSVLFSNFSYTQTASLNYEYMLEGEDDDWKALKGRSEIKWYNLSSGSYTLRIRWAGKPETEVAVPFHVGSPLGEGLTAIFIVLVLIGGGGLVVYYWRKKGRFLFHKIIAVVRLERKKETGGDASETEKYKTMKLSEEECTAFKEKLESLMREKKPYLNSDLKLKDLAVLMKTPVHQMSYLFNMSLHQRYNDYVNSLRIEEFKSIVATGGSSQFTLEALAERCGFSSKTSFFRNFKGQEGITPSEYVRKVEKEMKANGEKEMKANGEKDLKSNPDGEDEGGEKEV